MKNSDYYVGQDVVCVNADRIKHLEVGKTYTISAIKEDNCRCNSGLLINVGFKATHKDAHSCIKCGADNIPNDGLSWNYHWRFCPLDALCDISELTEHLKNTKPFEI